jgi:hypothetical protein
MIVPPTTRSATAQGPEELRVLIVICANNLSGGSDDLRSHDAVARQAVLRRQVADPSAERKPGHTGGAHHASGSDKAECLCRRVEVEPRRASARARLPRARVDLDRPHRRQVDDDAAVADAVSRRVVPAATNGDFEPVRAGEVEGGGNVGRSRTARDDGRSAVDQSVEADPSRVIARVVGAEHGARDGPLKPA